MFIKIYLKGILGRFLGIFCPKYFWSDGMSSNDFVSKFTNSGKNLLYVQSLMRYTKLTWV